MPVDNRVIQRYRLLDKYFRESDGNTYDELIDKLEDEGIKVSERTIKADKKYFEDNYNAVFAEGLRSGKQAVIRYEDISRSAFSETLTDEEKTIISKFSEKLQLHDDIPQYQWMLFLLDSLSSIDEIDDLEDYLMFENNLNLEGLENLKPIMEACVGKYSISLLYAPYQHSNTPKTYVISPYLLKQFNNRWYLIGKCRDYTSLSTFPLDRIVPNSIERLNNEKYIEPDRNSIGDNIYQSVGITSVFNPEFRKDVILKVSKERFPYIKTKPIIPSQQVLEDRCTDDAYFVSLEGITINKELESQILSFGPDVEVIEPAELRQKIKDAVSKASEAYSK